MARTATEIVTEFLYRHPVMTSSFSRPALRHRIAAEMARDILSELSGGMEPTVGPVSPCSQCGGPGGSHEAWCPNLLRYEEHR